MKPIRWTKIKNRYSCTFLALFCSRHGGCEWTAFSAPSQLVPSLGWVVLSDHISSNLPGSCGRLHGGHVPPAPDRGTETKIRMCHLVGLIRYFYYNSKGKEHVSKCRCVQSYTCLLVSGSWLCSNSPCRVVHLSEMALYEGRKNCEFVSGLELSNTSWRFKLPVKGYCS